MELTVAIISSIAGILTAVISASAYIISRREEVKEKSKVRRDGVRRKLALQVIGYHCEESLLANELSKYTNETPKQIKERLRELAKSHAENKEQTYPKMTAKDARDYLID